MLAAVAAATATIAGRAADHAAVSKVASTDATLSGRGLVAAGDVADGKKLYVQAGCSACHGLSGQGTKIGPAVAGHTAAEVQRQVRAPLDTMPAYSVARLSNDSLRKIGVYIVSLQPLRQHTEPSALPNLVATHHWLAITALKAGNERDALHHVAHIAERVQGEHLQAMREVRRLLRAGKLHDAEHLIEDMLAGRAEPKLSAKRLHLRVALSAIEARSSADARHHLGHFIRLARGAERKRAQTLLASLRRGDLHGAKHGVGDLLGTRVE